jgi:hypothetical protein
MATLNASDIADLIISTRTDLDLKGKMVNMATRLTRYYAKKLLDKNKLEVQAGDRIKGNALTNHSFSASMVGLHQVLEPNIPDLMTQFEIPWRHMNYNWSFERREKLMNRGRGQIFDMIMARRKAAEVSQAELLEQQIWSCPSTSSDTLNIHGIPYWVVKAASNAQGFNGGAPTGHTLVGNINPSTYTRWKNYNWQYTNHTDLDSLRYMRKAYRNVDFVSPVDIEDYKRGTGDSCMILANEATIDGLETVMRGRNDDHTDLAEFMGSTSFKKKPLQYVPYLDNDTDNPIYMLNFDYLTFIALDGDTNYEHEPMTTANQPNSFVVHVDLTLNFLCTDRRRQSVGSKTS